MVDSSKDNNIFRIQQQHKVMLLITMPSPITITRTTVTRTTMQEGAEGHRHRLRRRTRVCQRGIMRFQRVGSGGGNVIAGLVISHMAVLVEMVVVVRGGTMVMDRRITGFGACKSFTVFVVCCVRIFPFLLH